jgi:tetratricopeptide (TPR) repeat protein
MCRFAIIVSLCAFGLWALPALHAQPPQGSDPPAAAPSTQAAALSPRAVAAMFSMERTGRGVRVVSNRPGNHYAIELVGQEIRYALQPDRPVWFVDGILIQSLNVPAAAEMDLSDDRRALVGHQEYESDYFVKKEGWTSVEASFKWLAFPSGEPIRYWELARPNSGNEAVGMFYATTLNGRNVVGLGVTLFPGTDHAKARQLLCNTMLTLERREKYVAGTVKEPPLVSGNASMILLNDEIATRKDRKAESSVVLSPQVLIVVTRMAAQCDPQLDMLMLFDGHKGHVVNLDGYDRATKRFRYCDSLGAKNTFLGEGNNLAGVKAVPDPQHPGEFVVTEAELKKVLHAAFVPFEFFRPYYYAGNTDQAIQQYRQMQQRYPKSDELQEERLLTEAEILADEGEHVHACNLYVVCFMLHEKSARASAGIAAEYAALGRMEPAANFYAESIQKLAGDPSLDEKQRKDLAEVWSAARSRISAQPASTPLR